MAKKRKQKLTSRVKAPHSKVKGSGTPPPMERGFKPPGGGPGPKPGEKMKREKRLSWMRL